MTIKYEIIIDAFHHKTYEDEEIAKTAFKFYSKQVKKGYYENASLLKVERTETVVDSVERER
jgi:hypothetical protein